MRLLVEDLRSEPAKPNDRNLYQEGRLPSTDPRRPHGVVLALLPQDGNGNASAVCADLFRSYPDLECVVMCGIAGGIPRLDDPGRHVRLGDIVVGEEIISYGHIRRVDGEEVLRRPTGGVSADLVRGDNELRIAGVHRQYPWRQWVGDDNSRSPQFGRPPADSDVLYVDGRPVAHPDPRLSGHEFGWPKVHHGRIGSADVLMRDEVRRDELAVKHKLLAVEMEASGVASAAVLRNRSWFVVRGIVDYCENTGKNDAWHLYASLAAASYVRALLGVCHPFVRPERGHTARPSVLRPYELSRSASTGQREAAIEVVPTLKALDDACRGIGGSAEVVEALAERVAERFGADEPTMRDFHARVRLRGLDPRVLLPPIAQHDEALRRWIEPLLTVSDHRPSASLEVLAALVQEFVDQLAGPMFAHLSETSRWYLSRALLGRDTITMKTFLGTLTSLLPPLRSTSVEAVLLGMQPDDEVATTSARPRSAAEAYRQAELTSHAVQKLHLPDTEEPFAGRKDLVASIVAAIEKRMERHRSATAFLSGQPGVGTSAVAIEVARALIPTFPGGVFYVKLFGLLEKRLDPRDVVRAVSEALGLDRGDEAMDDTRWFADFAAQLHDRQVLLVLDDALDAQHVAALTKAPTSCGVIVTARNRVQSYANAGLVFRVEPLRREFSVEVLVSWVGERANEPQSLDRIADLCADVPLALCLIGTRMTSEPEVPLDEVARRLEKEVTRLEYLERGDRAVSAAISLSYDALDGPTREVFRLVAAAPGSSVTGPELAHCRNTPPFREELVLTRLVDRSLARQEIVRPATGGPLATFSLFDLVLLFAKGLLANEHPDVDIRDFQFRCVSYLRDRLAEIADRAPGADLSGEIDPARFHAAQRLAEEREWWDLATDVAVSLHALYRSRGELSAVTAVGATRVALHLRRGQPIEAVELCLIDADLLRGTSVELAMEAARRARTIAQDHDFPDLAAKAEFEISLVLFKMGDLAEALTSGERSATVLQSLGRNAEAVAIANNNCRLALQLGAADQALAWGRTATELANQHGSIRVRALAFLDRGRAEMLAGDMGAAVASGRRAEELHRANQDWWNAAVACSNGASAADADNDLATSIELSRLGVEHWERRGSLPYLLDALINLSARYVRAQAYDQASKTLLRAERAVRDQPDSTVSPGLRTELRIRRSALRLFLDAATLDGDGDPSDLPHADNGATADTGSQHPGPADSELDTVRDVLIQHRAGALTIDDARQQTIGLLAAGTRSIPPQTELWLHEEVGASSLTLSALRVD